MMRWLFGGLVLLIAGGCAAPAPRLGPAQPPAGAKLAYLVSHGWHVGIAVARADIVPALWPESADLGGYRYLEVGWGDGDYYRAAEGGVGLALRAAFSSESSVLHVAAFNSPVGEFFAGSAIVAIPLSMHGLDALARFIHAAYARDAMGRPIVLGPGLYGDSRFYRATGRYRLFDNSNNWTAKALRAAGCPIDPAETTTAGSVMHQAVAFGRVLRPGRVATRATLDEAETERCR